MARTTVKRVKLTLGQGPPIDDDLTSESNAHKSETSLRASPATTDLELSDTSAVLRALSSTNKGTAEIDLAEDEISAGRKRKRGRPGSSLTLLLSSVTTD
jgi:hypothetical protein